MMLHILRQRLLNDGYPVYQVAMMTDEEVVAECEEMKEELK